jgi:hypothetical protein
MVATPYGTLYVSEDGISDLQWVAQAEEEGDGVGMDLRKSRPG